MFLAAISELAAALARDPSAIRFARFCALFVIVAWAWILYTMYANRFAALGQLALEAFTPRPGAANVVERPFKDKSRRR